MMFHNLLQHSRVFHDLLLGSIAVFWASSSPSESFVLRLWSLCKFCTLVTLHGYAMLCWCCVMLCQFCVVGVHVLCCGYANAMQGYVWSGPKAVQSLDHGCAGSRLWLCWKSQWVQVWVCVGPSEGLYGSMCDIHGEPLE